MAETPAQLSGPTEGGGGGGVAVALRQLAPGLISGAADTDPTTVATLSVVGASTAFGLAWLVVLTFPVLAVIQAIAARIGVVAGTDLQGALVRHYSRRTQLVVLGSILVVSIITIAADLEGGAAAIGLLTRTNWHWFVAPLAAVLLALLFFGAYQRVQRVLRYAVLGLLTYVAAALLSHPHWGAVLSGTFIPRFHLNNDDISGALALLGTTLTSYVYVWQTIEEAEEAPGLGRLRARETGATIGIGFGVLLFWFILVATGATLGPHHVQVTTAQQAAQALRPAAGPAASDVFALGLLASAVVALPVIMATCAYIVGVQFDWDRGLSRSVHEAGRFYAVLALSVALGVGIAFSGLSPIRLLFVASIAGGLGTPVALVSMVRVASDRRVMGERTIGGLMRAGGWAAAAMMSVLSLVYLVQQLVAS